MKCARCALILSVAALAGLVPATTTAAVAASAQPAGNTTRLIAACRVAATIPVGGVPAGIAVDWKTNRIYVANRGDGTVSVINGQTNAVVATIPVGLRPGGVTVNWRINRAYVANAGGTVSVLAGC